jgi:hypothetical protein
VDSNRQAAPRQLLAANTRDKRHCEQCPRNRNQSIAKLRQHRNLDCGGRARLSHEVWNEVRLAR